MSEGRPAAPPHPPCTPPGWQGVTLHALHAPPYLMLKYEFPGPKWLPMVKSAAPGKPRLLGGEGVKEGIHHNYSMDLDHHLTFGRQGIKNHILNYILKKHKK